MLVVVLLTLATGAVFTDVAPRSLELQVLDELNSMRADPRAYAATLAALRGSYRGTLLLRGPGLAAIRTLEGEAALEEAIAVLERTPPLGPLTATAGLERAAGDHVRDTGATEDTGHRGRDGSNSFQRISRHGASHGMSGEVIDYGWDGARDIVIDLLIDDGIHSRSHRRAMLQSRYAQAGVACGAHQRFNVMCVVEFAEHYVDGAP